MVLPPNAAERVPGPADKVYSEANAVAGYVAHSMVGAYAGAGARLFAADRDAEGSYTTYAAASSTSAACSLSAHASHFFIW